MCLTRFEQVYCPQKNCRGMGYCKKCYGHNTTKRHCICCDCGKGNCERDKEHIREVLKKGGEDDGQEDSDDSDDSVNELTSAIQKLSAK
ncbi:hypothetical protein PPL_08534 [Heterostelium album PN500]|uniref:Uncharacterized protein n=1 Tax=Heterostelium pallidum (strain ATCC 26659 / Pp 5 / PN500) TaxID=670386 RepID=D3BIG4_HETP5|nr:hypothetical protein PPL_08534 [Heterostelium album PN500]EFA79064.1 hypothetical protein PPL_08534 [Heterostelium album PN500]|eukprot:XP_020431187.1 hypothetical protein PPL_08534 [Heterostelium album PN500]